MKPHYQDNHITLYNGDARNMAELEDESVQCVVTSPPYWGLRKYSGVTDLIWGGKDDCEHRWEGKGLISDKRGVEIIQGKSRTTTRCYGDDPTRTWSEEHQKHYQDTFCSLCGAWKGSYGLEPTPEMYIEHTVQFLREIRRVLRKDGVVFWNIGDSYMSSPSNQQGRGVGGSNAGAKGAFENIGRQKRISTAIIKTKDLCLIPFRVATAAQEDGWGMRSIIIWSKPNPMPESVTNRPTESHEYILMLTKSNTTQYWTHRDGGGTRVKPKADYRWVKVAPTLRGLKTKGRQELGGQEQHHGQDIDPNRLTIIEEVAVEPPDWKVKIKCPECEGTGKVDVYLGLDVWQEKKCPTCNGKKKTQLWKRINLWRGHDYYWDLEGVREEYTEPLNRWGGDTLKRETKKTAAFKDEILHLSPSSAMRAGMPIRPNLAGRNIRSVWEFPTRPYPEAHFAVFPEKLPETCIKAATPEAGCCSKCGAPWERVVDRQVTGELEDRPYCGDGQLRSNGSAGGQGIQHSSLGQQDKIKRKTTGWQPTCKCNAPRVPSIVLDPFAGAGTTLWVAKKLNRRAMGYELSQEYCDLAVKRNRQQVLM